MNSLRGFGLIAHLAVTALVLGRSADASDWTSIPLDEWANQVLSEDFHGFNGNNLKSLPRGDQTMLGVPFMIGESMIQLCSKRAPDFPDEVLGIEIGTTCTHIHLLQATGWGSPGVNEGKRLGHYAVHYADGSTDEIPINYGEDVRDWWKWDQFRSASRARVGWTGINEASADFRGRSVSLRLFVRTWVNPKPDVEISSLDFVTLNETISAPFCIAMTVERRLDEATAIQDLRDLDAHVKVNEDGHATEVSLALSRLTGDTVNHLSSLPDLKRLDLAANRLNRDDWGILSGLSQVRSLTLNQTNADDAALSPIGQMAELERLRLHQTKVTDDGLKHLGYLMNLIELDLSNTQITDAGLMQLNQLQKLRKLDVRKTNATREGVDRLQQSLPDCRIRN